MLGPIRFAFTVIWFAIGLGVVGTLKDCTASMGREAAIAHKHGGISYSWWNRQLVDGRQRDTKATRIPALAENLRKDKNEKDIRGGNSLQRPK